MKLVERFWSHVEKKNPDECWPWNARKESLGYGVFYVAGKLVRATRFMYELEVAKIRSGQLVLHSCDNPSCVNPAHLWIGNNLQNAHDKMRKGRHRTGNPQFRIRQLLTPEIGQKILTASGTQKEISARFGIGVSSVRSIKKGRHWSIR